LLDHLSIYLLIHLNTSHHHLLQYHPHSNHQYAYYPLPVSLILLPPLLPPPLLVGQLHRPFGHVLEPGLVRLDREQPCAHHQCHHVPSAEHVGPGGGEAELWQWIGDLGTETDCLLGWHGRADEPSMRTTTGEGEEYFQHGGFTKGLVMIFLRMQRMEGVRRANGHGLWRNDLDELFSGRIWRISPQFWVWEHGVLGVGLFWRGRLRSDLAAFLVHLTGWPRL